MWTVSCCKSGRWVRQKTEKMTVRAAVHMGFVDYVVEPPAQSPSN
ncbi:hypothetical protein [Tranquillimonas rosea]